MTANRIRQLRTERGLNQEQLGRLVGATKSKISRIENGETRLDMDMARRIAERLEVSVAEVLALEDYPHAIADDATLYAGSERDPLTRLADPAQSRVLMAVKTNALSELGILIDDVILVDMGPDSVARVAPLKPVVVHLHPPSDPTVTRTLIRQFVPPRQLITNSKLDNQEPINMDVTAAEIIGVIASWHRQFAS